MHARQPKQELLNGALVLFLLEKFLVTVLLFLLLLLEEVVLLLLGLALGKLNLLLALATVFEVRSLVFASLLLLPEVVLKALVLFYLLIQ